MLSLKAHRAAKAGEEAARLDWQSDLPGGRPVFSPSLRTAAELISGRKDGTDPGEPGPQAG
jgi:hypothetical protein